MGIHQEESSQEPTMSERGDTSEAGPGAGDASNPSEALVECPNCGYRFVGMDLVNKPCPSCGDRSGQFYFLREQPKLDEPLVEVYRAPDWFQAEMIREYLLSEGVLVAFSTSMPWGVMTFTVDGLGEVSVLAVQSEAEQARTLIEEYLKRVESAPPTEPEEEE